MTLRSGLAAALALATMLAVSVSSASAHARYERSTPAMGEVLATSPASVTIEFTQDVQKISGTYGIGVTNEGGQPVTAGSATLNDENRSLMSVQLTAELQAGRYVVRWTNISDADGDPAEGAFSFYVGRQPSEAERVLDAELAGIGADETPSATPALIATPGIGPTASPPDTAGDASADNGVPTLVIVGGAVIGAAVLAALGWFAWGLRGH